jgi:hypothetical protein
MLLFLFIAQVGRHPFKASKQTLVAAGWEFTLSKAANPDRGPPSVASMHPSLRDSGV